jgi:CheY-like chemotaxis protein
MDDETLDRIFDPFFTTRPRGQGAGLGLATVYGIVKQSHGHISVDSRPGQGTTFQVYFPAQTTPAERGHEAPAERGHEAPATHIRQGTETILIVEDEPQLRKLTRIWLEGFGYSVIEAAGAGEAFNMLESGELKIHLLITDLVMPGLNGRQLAEQVCAKYPSIRLVFMTGYTDDVVVQHKLLQPGSHLLRKPFSRAELARTVREVLEK